MSEEEKKPRGKDRRKTSNIVVDSRALLRVSIPFLILIISNSVIIFLINMRYSQITEDLQVNDLAAVRLVTKIGSEIISPLTWGIFFISFLALAIWVLFSHHIFGPIVPIRRYIQGLTKGNYDSRLQLRTRDEFSEIAMDLNQLTDVLRDK